MIAQVVLSVEGEMISHDVALDELVVFMTIRGHAFKGFHNGTGQRAELHSQPKLEGIAGPMYGRSDIVRYKNVETY